MRSCLADNGAVAFEHAALQKNGLVLNHAHASQRIFAVWCFSHIKSQRFQCSPKAGTHRRVSCKDKNSLPVATHLIFPICGRANTSWITHNQLPCRPT